MNPILRTATCCGFLTSAALLATVAGCSKAPPEVQPVAAPATPAQAAAPAPVVLVQPTVVLQDDYVYYPAYEVYYSSRRHDYRYRDGNAWVTRAAPPRVSVDVLFASPSVRLDFHDAPERHHDATIRSYPKNWSPPGRGRGEQDDRKDERKDDRKEKR